MLPLKHKAEDLLNEMEEAIRMVRLVFNEETREDIQKHLLILTLQLKTYTVLLIN